MINPTFGLLSDPKHTQHAKLSLMVLELITVKIYDIVESGNAGQGLFQPTSPIGRHLTGEAKRPLSPTLDLHTVDCVGETYEWKTFDAFVLESLKL